MGNLSLLAFIIEQYFITSNFDLSGCEGTVFEE